MKAELSPTSDDDTALMEQSERLAERLLGAAGRLQGNTERRQAARITRLLDDPDGFAFVLALTDEVLRIRDPSRAARHLQAVIDETASPRFLGPLDRTALRIGGLLAPRFPGVVMPLVAARLRAELSGYVLDAGGRPLRRHIERRRRQGIRLNINLLGEAVLGDEEAERRLRRVLALLERTDVDYISVKISSVCAQLNVAAFDDEVDRVAAQLRRLYDAAAAHEPAKFVNLDMEEYGDLGITVAAFRRVLDEEPYRRLDAGIVLQAYIPDSLAVLRQLCSWACERNRASGGTVKIRIVKGANLAMEKVEAALHGWPQAPFETKGEVDASYKRMLDVVLSPAHAGALRVGVASHNLLELAWALTVSRARGLAEMVEVEMLEGMAPSTAAALRQEAGHLLLYAPVADRADFESVIAYLVRRFDENTGPENFLRHQYVMKPGAPEWDAEKRRFEAAVAARHQTPPPTRRTQDRGRQQRAAERSLVARAEPAPLEPVFSFANEPDTDFSLAANPHWVKAHLAAATGAIPDIVPVVVAGRRLSEPAAGEGIDPFRPSRVAYRWVQADLSVVEEAVTAAGGAGDRWRATPAETRARIIDGVGDALNARRGRLIACMAVDGGKTLAEADPEVTEAVDFARYYASSVARIQAFEADGARFTPLGTVVVIPPWNFPLAIPAGGVFAALAAGNAVILKPAPETVATAWALAEACWSAGVPDDVLQFVPCADDEAATRLVTHPGVGGVILTGSWDTARLFLGWRPTLPLRAETSGKNAIVVTAAADLDAAVADLVQSAFGHAGQKCSAASLAIVEASVYDDPRFRRQLADAVQTLRVGAGWQLASTMGPLIRPPEGPLREALAVLDDGETWLVRPRQIGPNPQLWSPGVKLGVAPASPFHLTECFGPVLGVMRAESLAQATAWQNQPAYGLTAGLHSLDPVEIRWWTDNVEAGNLYVNRHITGAVVRRQPFGGWKHSVVGPAAKAGGPNYLLTLGTWQATSKGDAAHFAEDVRHVWVTRMGPSDRSGLEAEANVLRYRPLGRVTVRAGGDVADEDLMLAVAAGRALGVTLTISSPTPRPGLGGLDVLDVRVETDDALVERLAREPVDKLRILGVVCDDLRMAAHDSGVWVDDTPVVAHPQLEALRWVREQAVSQTRHRHGNITGRHPGPVAGAG